MKEARVRIKLKVSEMLIDAMYVHANVRAFRAHCPEESSLSAHIPVYVKRSDSKTVEEYETALLIAAKNIIKSIGAAQLPLEKNDIPDNCAEKLIKITSQRAKECWSKGFI
ncbi:hypothetical protein BK025_09010 [Sodalis sp. TME1]|nr:hypothetical protein BK025_09010 [Sodalis sp. TME1]